MSKPTYASSSPSIFLPHPSYAQVRMQAITEVRNYLMAANRNLVAVHRLISPVNVPYCTADEVRSLAFYDKNSLLAYAAVSFC